MRYGSPRVMFGRILRNSLLGLLGLLVLSTVGPAQSAVAHGIALGGPKAAANFGSSSGSIPTEQTPANQLSTSSHQHQEVLRIRRDFGKPYFIIGLDAWVRRSAPADLTEVRLWWINLRHGDRRGPFSKRTMSHFDIEYARNGPSSWDVLLLSDGKRFRFRVELGTDRQVRAYATVTGSGGTRVRRCLAGSGELVARRFFGIPTGIDSLVVNCVDPTGKRRVAPVVTDGSL